MPSLLSACTSSPLEGAETGPSRGFSSRWSVLCLGGLCLFSWAVSPAAVQAQSSRGQSSWRFAFRVAEPGLFEVSWRKGLNTPSDGNGRLLFYGHMVNRTRGSIGGVSMIEVAPARSFLLGVDLARSGVGHVSLGAMWHKEGVVWVRVPVLQPAPVPLRSQLRALRWADLGRGVQGKAAIDWSPGSRPALRLMASDRIWHLGAGSTGAWAGRSSSPQGACFQWTGWVGFMRGGLLWVGVAWGTQNGPAPWAPDHEPAERLSP